jgi:hypothetical protein
MVALWIKTITATQRTAVKGYEGGDTVAVNTHAVTVDTYQRRFDMVDTSHFFSLLFLIGNKYTDENQSRASVGDGCHRLLQEEGTDNDGADGVEIDVVGGADGTKTVDDVTPHGKAGKGADEA